MQNSFTTRPKFAILIRHLRKHSSVGRAPALQAGGHRFEPYCFHQYQRCIHIRTYTRISLCVSMREWLSGRALPCQGKCREFESRLPLHNATLHHGIGIGIPLATFALPLRGSRQMDARRLAHTREFESRLPLHNATLHHGIGIGIPFSDIRLTAARFKTNGRSQARSCTRGSNLVSRSKCKSYGLMYTEIPSFDPQIRHHSQVVRQSSAKASPPVQVWVVPPKDRQTPTVSGLPIFLRMRGFSSGEGIWERGLIRSAHSARISRRSASDRENTS